MNELSIRWRLTLWYGAVLAAVLAAFSTAVFLMMRHELLARTDSDAMWELEELAEGVERTDDTAELRALLARQFTEHEGFEFQVSSLLGEVIFRSDGLRNQQLAIPTLAAGSATHRVESVAVPGVGYFRIFSRRVRGPDGPVIVQAAAPLASTYREQAELLTTLLLAGPLALAGALGGGYLLARKALAPVERMAATANQITASRLDQRLEVPAVSDELGRLARTLNGMIARLERSFEETRRFTADAAHELRTPLSVMRNEAEVALRAPREPEQYRRVLENLLEEIEWLTRLAEQLLFLCREDSGLALFECRQVRLDEVVGEVADHMQAVAAEKGQTVSLEDLPPVIVEGDADQLRRLLFNLVDNAIKYTPVGGTVVIRGRCRDGQAIVEITDTGIGIPEAHLPHIFERFYRVDPARGRQSEGTGLGLAISRAIAEAHRGTLRIESVVGYGTRVALTLPGRAAERVTAGLPG
ncbi:MAG TPA: heavy metal sensor histidine kinase [Isosphaeraceae bacterium]|jgi:heavy metal sensor kinase|nr:heavy metal sensor histidine kinase [Isosphaeraceae bacterium]